MDEKLYTEFLSLNNRIDRFLEEISPVVSYDSNKARRRFQLILVRSLTLLAIINLNVAPSWTSKSVDAAEKLAHILDDFELREIRFLHPVMAVSELGSFNETFLIDSRQKFWATSGQVLIAEFVRLQGPLADEMALRELDKLEGTLKRLERVMGFFAVTHPAIGI